MRTLVLMSAGLILSASTAVAQTPPPPPPVQTPRPVPPPLPVDGYLTFNAALQDSLRNSPEAVSAQENRERWKRAERLAELINQGQCKTAHRIATQEGDEVMAARIVTACTPNN